MSSRKLTKLEKAANTAKLIYFTIMIIVMLCVMLILASLWDQLQEFMDLLGFVGGTIFRLIFLRGV